MSKDLRGAMCVCLVDHDDSPNSPPSAVSSQGSSVDISLARDVSYS